MQYSSHASRPVENLFSVHGGGAGGGGGGDDADDDDDDDDDYEDVNITKH